MKLKADSIMKILVTGGAGFTPPLTINLLFQLR